MQKLSIEKIRIIAIATLSLLLLIALLCVTGCTDMGLSLAVVLPGLTGTHIVDEVAATS